MAYTYGSVNKCTLVNGTTPNHYECRLGYQVNSQNTNNRTSNVTLRLEVRSINSSYQTYGYNQTTTIDGTKLAAATFDMRDTNVWQVFGTRTITVQHNSNGVYSATKNASFTTTASSSYSLKSGSASVTVHPADINVKGNLTASANPASQITYISGSYTYSKTFDKAWYSINNGDSWVSNDPSYATSTGTFGVTRLQPNTSYPCKIKVQDANTGEQVESSTFYASTLDYPKFNLSSLSATIGTMINLTWSNPSNNDHLNLRLLRSNKSTLVEDLGAVHGTSAVVLPVASNIYNLAGSSSYVDLYFELSSTEMVGHFTDYISCRFYVSGENAPTFNNFECSDTNSTTTRLTGSSSRFIRKYSNIRVTISSGNKMIPKNGASGNYYNVIVGNQSTQINYSSSSSVSGTIYNMDSNVVNVYAVDSRNMQTLASKSLTIVPYTECVIRSLRIDRADGVGTSATINMSGTYDNINFGSVSNSITAVEMRIRSTSGSWGSWQSIKAFVTTSNGRITASNVKYTGFTFTLGTEYRIQVRVTDQLSSTTEEVDLTDGQVLWSAAKGMGVNFGGLYDPQEGGALQVNGKKIEPTPTGEFLPLTGGTIKGEVTIQNSSGGASGGKLKFGDGDYVHLYEDEDDHLEIKAKDGLNISTSGQFTLNGNVIKSINVINNLSSSSITDALSANQGRTLLAAIEGKVTQGSENMSGLYNGVRYYIVLGNLLLQWGRVSISPSANSPTSYSISFPRSFSGTPCVVCSPDSAAIGTQVLGTSISNLDYSGFDIYLTRTNSTSTSVNWFAIGPD